MPRKETVRAGIGAAGVRGRPQLKKDVIEALKKKKALEASVARNQRRIKRGQKAQTISERGKQKLLKMVRTPAQRIRHIQARAADLRVRANKVAGNKKAAAAYRQAARELLARIPALRAKGK